MSLADKKKRALELMGTKSLPSGTQKPKDEGPILNETGDQPRAGRFMNIIAKRRGMKELKK